MLFKVVAALSIFTSLTLGNPIDVRDTNIPRPHGMPVRTLSTTTTTTGSCTTTIPVVPDFTQGPTETIWTLTSTETHLVDCGSCSALTTNNLPFGPGPAVIFTETVIATTPTTTVVMECKPTGNTKAAGAGKKIKVNMKAKAKMEKAKQEAKAKQAKAKQQAKNH